MSIKVAASQFKSIKEKKDLNINKAIDVAKRKGIFCIGLLGRDGGEAKKKVDIDITVNSKRTCRIQEMHSLIIHILCGLIEKNYCLHNKNEIK